MWIDYVAGFAFSILGSYIFVRFTVNTMWIHLGWTRDMTNDELRPFAYQSVIIGSLESIMYTSCWLIGKHEFIGVWLILKVGGQWGRWTQELTIRNRQITGRSIFNIFLVGNALVILYSIIGAMLIEWINKGKIAESIAVPVLLVIITFFIVIYTKKQPIPNNS